MLIPKHLREISDLIDISKNCETTKIKCKCGCIRFIVYNYVTPLEFHIKTGFDEITREKDKLYLIKRNFFGKIVDKIECNNAFNEKPRNIVKIKCEKCKSEYVVFDNYIHGYNAVVTFYHNTTSYDVSPKFEKVYPTSLEVFVKIYQDVSYDLFQEEFDNLDFETYLNSFGNIEIYGVTSNSKKIKIYLEETA